MGDGKATKRTSEFGRRSCILDRPLAALPTAAPQHPPEIERKGVRRLAPEPEPEFEFEREDSYRLGRAVSSPCRR
jgi:hypothetical protein